MYQDFSSLSFGRSLRYDLTYNDLSIPPCVDIPVNCITQIEPCVNIPVKCNKNKSAGIFELFIQRLKKIDFLIVYILSILVIGLFFLTYLFGIFSPWYATLIPSSANVWLIRSLWIVTAAISYIGLYILWDNVATAELSRDLGVTVLFMVGNFITVAWSVALLQAQNIALAVWISSILFLYQFWLFVYIWFIKPKASYFLLPLLAMYLYLVYEMINLALLNNVQL